MRRRPKQPHIRTSRRGRRFWAGRGKIRRASDISDVLKKTGEQRLREHQSRQYQILISEGTPRTTAYEMVYRRQMEFGIPQLVLPQYREKVHGKNYGNWTDLGPVSDTQVKRVGELRGEIADLKSRKPRNLKEFMDRPELIRMKEKQLENWLL